MDYITFAKAFFYSSGIPVNLLQGRIPVFSSLSEQLELPLNDLWPIQRYDHNPAFCRFSTEIEYGVIWIENTDYFFVVGPTFSTPLTDSLLMQYMQETRLPLTRIDAVREYLSSIPTISRARFSWVLLMCYMSLNQKDYDLDVLYNIQGNEQEVLSRKTIDERIQRLEEDRVHHIYHFEKQLYQALAEGNEEKLNRLFHSVPPDKRVISFSPSAVRHAKDLFIINISKLVYNAAIPGGMDEEDAYQLMDTYIRECEQLHTMEAVEALQYSMMKDYCRRIAAARLPQGISPEISKCIRYIRDHVNTPLTVADVAEHIGKSESYTIRRFKAEMGVNMGVFIADAKLEEAKTLLLYSTQSLSEISYFLCYSSQSYFQNVFKKKYGVTPMQFRKKGSI